MSLKIIMIVGHGSRRAESNNAFQSLVRKFQARHPSEDIRFAFVELAQPAFRSALEKAACEAKRIIVVPLFLLTAGHIKQDIMGTMALLKKRFSHVEFLLASALGPHQNMVNLILKRLKDAGSGLSVEPRQTSVLMIGRGSSDPGANSDFCKLVRLVEEKMPYDRITYGFIAVVRPKVREALDRLILEKPQAIIIQPYLIFDGVLYRQLRDMTAKYKKLYPDISFRLSAPLGEDPLLLEVLDRRLSDAQKGRGLSFCVSCGGVIL